jgi:hypothetical protein
MTLLLWLIHRSQVLSACGIVLGETTRLALATVASFAPAAAVAALLGGGWWEAPAAAIGLAGFVVVLRTALPEHAAVARRMFGPILAGMLRRREAVG